jgi:hypothetical protein
MRTALAESGAGPTITESALFPVMGVECQSVGVECLETELVLLERDATRPERARRVSPRTAAANTRAWV